MIDGMRMCTVCRTDKSEEEFNRNRAKSSGFNSACKACAKVQQAKWYQTHKTEHRKNTKVASDKFRKVNREKILAYLLEHPCVDCGEKDPVVLEFDHQHNKRDVVSRMTTNNGWERVAAEIAKCQVRCANCHRRKTSKDFDWYKSRVGSLPAEFTTKNRFTT